MLPLYFKDGIQIIQTIEKFNHQAYFVGGCVRDLLLDKTVGDIDIATSASPNQIMEIFPNVIPVGLEHGTVIVRYKKQSYEVTTFRLDGKYTDQRHPDSVKFIRNIDEDLKRRDFTINALAMNKNGEIIDLFSGQTDLQKKLIRAVGNAYTRFSEDPLRMIRALRFSSQLGFTIEERTFKKMQQAKHQIETIAVERITNEMTKLFAGKHVNLAISYLQSSGIDKYLPTFKKDSDLIHKLPKLQKPLTTFAEVITLFHVIKPEISITQWIKQWKCSNLTKQQATELTNAIKSFQHNGLNEMLVYQLSSSNFNGFINVIDNLYTDHNIIIDDLHAIKASLAIESMNDLAINGLDLMAIFPDYKKGRWIGNCLKTLEIEVVNNNIKNTKKDLKEWIKCNPPVVN